MYLYDSQDECVADEQHGADADDDGYCNLCGHPPTDEED